ncbi:hypothetical protein [Streptomyces sp. NBC_00872]|nr:hypothetical protein OG214_33545 [Streptomyces sp. NBC_00872]
MKECQYGAGPPMVAGAGSAAQAVFVLPVPTDPSEELDVAQAVSSLRCQS